jgi:chromosome segregation ATPase
MRFTCHLLQTALFTGLLFGLTGCQTSYDRAREVRLDIHQLTGEADQAYEQIDRIARAIDGLQQQQRDLRQPYNRFVASVQGIEARAQAARERLHEITQAKEAYIVSWEQDMAKIENPDIRAKAHQRRRNVAAELEDLRGAAARVTRAYEPFVADLNDVQVFLANDLTAASIDAIGSTLDDIRQEAQEVRRTLRNYQQHVDNVDAALRPRQADNQRQDTRERQPNMNDEQQQQNTGNGS